MPTDEELVGANGSLSQILVRRRSETGFEGITIRELGEFLFRTFRVSSEIPGDKYFDHFVQKVYPSGGSLHSLRLYIIAHNCNGLAEGLYRYDDRAHCLAFVSRMTKEVEAFSKSTVASVGTVSRSPPIVFVITSLFQRVAWKYQSIAYRLVLLEVGALMQTMYLVGTAMGLASRALGGGNADEFSLVAGIDPYYEPSVGEFILGRTKRAILSEPDA